MTHTQLARHSLEGLSIGDAFGDQFFCAQADEWIARRQPPAAPWHVTDDTILAQGQLHCLQTHGEIDQATLAHIFATLYEHDPHRGYGPSMHRVLRGIAEGQDWRALTQTAFDGMGSMGNGGAMRAGPLGAYFHDDISRLCEEARRATEVTHAHTEAQAGAIAVALAAAWGCLHQHDAHDAQETFLPFVIARTPASDLRIRLQKAHALPRSYAISTATAALGNGSKLTAGDTVPFALWCAARHLTHFEEALWSTVSGQGDRDTNCAIVASIVHFTAQPESVPTSWRNARTWMPLPPSLRA